MDWYREHEARERLKRLVELRLHWGEAYIITFTGGIFRAERRDNHAATTAPTLEELREEIIADYSEKPVSKNVAVPTEDEIVRGR